MRTIGIICRRALPLGIVLLLLKLGAGAAQAQTVDVRQACTPDAMRLCNNFIPDEAKVKSCMMAKRRELSVECRTAIAAMHHGRHTVHVRRVVHYRHHKS
jgi:hypothetical protein